MDEQGDEEDVIIEGSDLHRALVKMGYTDFEFTPLNKIISGNKEQSERSQRLETVSNYLKSWFPASGLSVWFPKRCYVSSEQFAMILRAESLLDDHAERVRCLAEKSSGTIRNKFAEWSNVLLSTATIGIVYSIFKRKRTLPAILATFIVGIGARRRCEEFLATKALRDLVMAQNELYRLYKKSLGVLRNVYRLRADGNKPRTKFSNLENYRLKYLQPITETLLKSMEKVSRTYHQASSMIVELLPQAALENDTLTNFDADSFVISGEITYEKLRHLYYVYILVQSDTMQLLAIAYNSDTWMSSEKICHSKLNRIMDNLCRVLREEKNKLGLIIAEYDCCERPTVERKFRIGSTSKWRDLYFNLDLLSRKLQIAYDEVASILQEIERRAEDVESEDLFIAELAVKTEKINSQIEKSRNFAEFNNLLVAILQRSKKPDHNPISELDSSPRKIEDERRIVRDSEPQIIDEVFEEYITEEYLKPLYEDDDEGTTESAKLDKLLATNFMSELKEVLVEKYKSMSEREAKALFRKYQGTRDTLNFDSNPGEVTLNTEFEKSTIPHPPPMPRLDETANETRTIFIEKQKIGTRGPVPLPRTRNFDEAAEPRVPQRSNVPGPPAPLPPLKIDTEDEKPQRFSIDLPTLGSRRIPAFVTFEEEFIGSGENSEEEIEIDDNDKEGS